MMARSFSLTEFLARHWFCLCFTFLFDRRNTSTCMLSCQNVSGSQINNCLAAQAIMAKTILRGEPIIFGHKVIDSVSVKKKNDNGKYSRVSLKLRHWKAVMSAGMSLHRIGRFDDGQACEEYPRQPRLILELPPAGDEAKRAEYHNRMMWLGERVRKPCAENRMSRR